MTKWGSGNDLRCTSQESGVFSSPCHPCNRGPTLEGRGFRLKNAQPVLSKQCCKTTRWRLWAIGYSARAMIPWFFLCPWLACLCRSWDGVISKNICLLFRPVLFLFPGTCRPGSPTETPFWLSSGQLVSKTMTWTRMRRACRGTHHLSSLTSTGNKTQARSPRASRLLGKRVMWLTHSKT